ncbi:hypothetical protein C8F04DRAFT_1182745 [Mycena alexandri]|uniref:Uncharacterized protein n=1 Tax=Mycena alexandri TaxID=1745969 RepID=A0AAD6SWE6_9AGAR|nr:hypothetical protein C8F04DRAFT_1182745 [Mycena alexandri]
MTRVQTAGAGETLTLHEIEERRDEDSEEYEQVYLTVPRVVAEANIHAAERTETSTRKARKMVLDGVYPPRRERAQIGDVKDLQKEELLKRGESIINPAPLPRQSVIDKGSTEKFTAKPSTRPASKPEAPPEIQPFEARRARFSEEDAEMENAGDRERKHPPKRKSGERSQTETGLQNDEEKGPKTVIGRQSELSSTVDKKIPMSLRELFVTSKEIRTEIQDLIKVKNVRAVLLGSTRDHPLIANLNWPREEDILRAMNHERKPVSACLDEKGNIPNAEPSCADAIMNGSTYQSGPSTHPASAADLALASLNLARAFIEVWAYIIVLALSRAVEQVSKEREGEVYKGKGPHTAVNPIPTRLLQLLMSLSQQTPNQLPLSLLRHDGGNPAAPEPFQYLSRMTFSEPPVPVVRLSAAGPVETVADAVARQWQKVVDNQPIDVDPTFCAAPQSEYYGSVTLPNGQELHRSSSQNVFRVFRNRTTGLPYTLSCHEFTFHLTTPRNPHHTWSLELVYPNDTRIRDAMKTMSPLDSEDDVGFPVHATPQAPPMVPMTERLRVSCRISAKHRGTYLQQMPVNTLASPAQVREAETRRLADERGVRPEDTQTVGPAAAHLTELASKSAQAAGVFRLVSARGTHEEELEGDIERRALSSLSLDGDPFYDAPRPQRHGRSLPSQEETFRNLSTERAARGKQAHEPLLSNSYDDLPDLVYADANDSDSSVDMGVCGLCLEAQHKSTRDCPLFGPRERHTYDASAVGVDAQSRPAAGTDAESASWMGAWDNDERAAPGGAEEAFSMEMRRVLDVALQPTLKEWMSLPLSQPLTFQALQTIARDARVAFEMFTNDTALGLAEMREKNRQQLEQDEFEEDWERQMARESSKVLEQLVKNNERAGKRLRKEVDARLEAQTLALRVRARMNEESERKAVDPNYVGSFSPLDRSHATSDSPFDGTHFAQLSPPATSNPRRGRVVTRDRWSSSDSATSDSYSQSYDEVSIPPLSALGERLSTLDSSWGSARSEGSVEVFSANPTWVIDDAIARMRELSTGENESSGEPPASTRNSSSLSSYRLSSPGDHSPERPTMPLELQEALMDWVEEGAEHRRTTNYYEEEMVCDPGRQALEILHGSLARFVDYDAMEAEGVRVLTTPSPLERMMNASFSSDSDAGPGPTQTATSLDYSLPSGSESSSARRENWAAESTGDDGVMVVASDLIATSLDVQPPHASGFKRKRSEDDEEGSNQTGRRKKFLIERAALSAAGLTDTRITELFAGVRLGILETSRRAEEMAIYRFEVSERSFPAFFAHHPLLHDLEAAKLQVLAHILRRQGCEGPAKLLYEILAIRLRDEYAISHLLNAGYLEDNFPEETSRYWELMGVWPDRCDPEELQDIYRLTGDPRLRLRDTESDPESERSAEAPHDDDARSDSIDMEFPSIMYPHLRDERPPTGIDDSVIDPVPRPDSSPSPGPLFYPTDEELAEHAARFAEHAADTRLVGNTAPISLPLSEFLRERAQVDADVFDDPVAFRAACIRAGIEQRTCQLDDPAYEAHEEDLGDRSDDDFVVLGRNALGLHFD